MCAARLLELLEKLDGRHRLRGDQRRDEQVLERRGQADRGMRPECLDRDHPHHLVAVFWKTGKYGVSARHDLPPVRLLVVVDVKEDDLRARGHDRRDGEVVERQHALDHLLLGPLEHARVEPPLDKRPHILIAHGLGHGPGLEAEPRRRGVAAAPSIDENGLTRRETVRMAGPRIAAARSGFESAIRFGRSSPKKSMSALMTSVPATSPMISAQGATVRPPGEPATRTPARRTRRGPRPRSRR